MHLDFGKTRLTVTFPFAAVVSLMLIFCDEEIVVISLFSSLFHEAGHLFFMLCFSCAPSEIVFGAFGIRIERTDERPLSYKKEAIVALGGIFANIFLVLCGIFFYNVYNSLWALKILTVNVFVALFNMLPVSLLDFGRCLECALCAFVGIFRCREILRIISVATVILIAGSCVIYNVFVGINVSFIAVSTYIVSICLLKEFKND